MYGRSSAVDFRTVLNGRVRLPHILSTGGAFHRDAPRPQGAGIAHAGLPAAVAQRLSSFAVAAPQQQQQQQQQHGIVPDTFRGPRLPFTPPEEAKERTVLSAVQELVRSGETNAFCMYDLSVVESQLSRWRRELPRVEPFYAVKCNPNEKVVSLLAQHGASFDCASQAEIELVQQQGVDAHRVIFANPCKQPSHVAYAASRGIGLTVFDGADELFKMSALQPHARLLLRILVDDSHAVCTMSQKYGAPLAEIPELLSLAKSLDLDIAGVSFHVGSGSRSAQPFADAVRSARTAFDMAAEMGIQMNILDIGGGFPGAPEGSGGGRAEEASAPELQLAPAAESAPSFEKIAELLRPALDTHFPAGSGVRVIAEPGRYFVSSAATLATSIIGRKIRRRGGGLPDRPMYFVNDGLYGSFNCVLYDHAAVTPLPLFQGESAAGAPLPPLETASVWGPTCDGLDCILKETQLPRMSVGDWLQWPSMGAYTSAAGSTFNGMERPSDYYF